MFRALAEGRIGLLTIVATNPAVSSPEGIPIRRTPARAAFPIVSETTVRV
ncbi:MAG: hypothetical protein RML45_06680 [Acetobacteraceae bacterium]|nr:hypothetical protein [Acetobacteraceae bacterium]